MIPRQTVMMVLEGAVRRFKLGYLIASAIVVGCTAPNPDYFTDAASSRRDLSVANDFRPDDAVFHSDHAAADKRTRFDSQLADGAIRPADAKRLPDIAPGRDGKPVVDATPVVDAAPVFDGAAADLPQRFDGAIVDGNQLLDQAVQPGDLGGADSTIVGGCTRRTFAFYAPYAKTVYATGSFTRPTVWAGLPKDGARPLVYKGSGVFLLHATMPPQPTHHRYKYVVDEDAIWDADQFNPQKESDLRGGFNSIAGNWHTFIYADRSAQSVKVTGTFVSPQWSDKNALPLKRHSYVNNVFVLSFELPAGRHRYKFIVKDSRGKTRWIHDPWGQSKESDGTGLGYNSIVDICR
jgi:hypothetical protein